MKTMSFFSAPTAWALCAVLCSAACAAPPKTPAKPPAPALSDAYAAAFDAEAADPASVLPYLDAIDKAIADPDAPGALPTVIASIDALVFGATPNTIPFIDHALVFRSREHLPAAVARLRRAWFSAGEHPKARYMPFMRGFLAHALHRLALFVGDEQPASVWVRRRACVGEAALIGPLDAMPLLGVSKPSPIAKPQTPFLAQYPGVAPFASTLSPLAISADTCMLDVNAGYLLQGARSLVIDIDNPRNQTLSFALTSPLSAALDVGGARLIERGYDAGGSFVTKLAQAEVGEGRVRAVITVGYKNDGEQVELDIWDEDGLSLPVHAPKAGDVAAASVRTFDTLNFAGHPVHGLKGRSENDLALASAALLALGDSRAAEHLLEPPSTTDTSLKDPERSPRLELLYARAIDAAQDMSENKAVERTRKAIEKVGSAWPSSWEARIMKARLAERRRGAGDGVIVALKTMGIQAPSDDAQGIDPAFSSMDRMSAAYVALLAHRARLIDVAEDAYTALSQAAPGSSLLAAVDARLHTRTGPDLVKAACQGGTSRADTGCLEAHLARTVPSAQAGDFKAAMSEIARLRRLKNSPSAFRELEVGLKLNNGDLEGALAAHALLPPARQRQLDIFGYSLAKEPANQVRERWTLRANQGAAFNAADMPFSLPPLYRALGLVPDPAPALESEGRNLVLADQKEAFMPGAATAILKHIERYQIDASGLVYYLSYDLRRVSGTTDVAQGGMSFGPSIDGRNASRLLRRRIHKRDGRMLEPDAAANAMQWSDLSQLEQGDYVEQILEGYALPGDNGQLVIDTPDLMPERTSVRTAEIEVKHASKLRFSRWSHALLGRPIEEMEGEYKVLTYRLIDALPRRIEDGVSPMERAVALSLGTQDWDHIGRSMDENVQSLEDKDPFVKRYAEQIAAELKAESKTGAIDSKTLIERVVKTVGKRIKVAGGAELSDVSAAYGGGSQRTTARTMLELGQGSRTWVIYRLLQELHIPVDLAVSETEPFSASPDFPAHFGRFRHPLLVAHVDQSDVWIDADVEGPPLPPGRISPELRGRSAMLKGGKIVTVQGTGGENGDEADLSLTLDEKGNAKGTLVLKIHGRAAQSLADALDVIVGTERRQMLQAVVLGWLPWADVENVALTSSEGSWEVEIRASVKIVGYAQPLGQDAATWVLPGIEPVHFTFPRAYSGTLGATYASRGARQSALVIDSPLQYRVRRTIALPAGTQIIRRPEQVTVAGKQLEASRSGKYGAVIEEDFVLNLPTGTINADVYPAFVEKVRAIDDGFMAGTRVRAKP